MAKPKLPTDPKDLLRKENLLSVANLHLGVFIIAIGVHFFKFPNHFAMGGVAGLSIVLSKVVPAIPPAWMASTLNMLSLVLGFAVFGKAFAFRTAYATTLLSVLQVGFNSVIPMSAPMTDEPLLELFFAIFCSAVGSAILFNIDASTGGTDIVAMIVKKYSTLDIGKALLLTDILIGASTFFLFDVKTGLFSIGGILLKGVVVDSFIESLNRVKYFTIICSKDEPISEFITHTLNRSATRLEGEGMFTHDARVVLLCVVNRYQAVILRQFIKKTDPTAFMMITNTSEIIGRGFHSLS